MDGKKTQDECVFEAGEDEVDHGIVATVVKFIVKADDSIGIWLANQISFNEVLGLNKTQLQAAGLQMGRITATDSASATVFQFVMQNLDLNELISPIFTTKH